VRALHSANAPQRDGKEAHAVDMDAEGSAGSLGYVARRTDISPQRVARESQCTGSCPAIPRKKRADTQRRFDGGHVTPARPNESRGNCGAIGATNRLPEEEKKKSEARCQQKIFFFYWRFRTLRRLTDSVA